MCELETLGDTDGFFSDSILPMDICFMIVEWKVIRFSGFGSTGKGASLPYLICWTMRCTLVMLTLRNLAMEFRVM